MLNLNKNLRKKLKNLKKLNPLKNVPVMLVISCASLASSCLDVQDVEPKILDVNGDIYNTVKEKVEYNCRDFEKAKMLQCFTAEEVAAIYKYCPTSAKEK